jgi:hypothetical protein
MVASAYFQGYNEFENTPSPFGMEKLLVNFLPLMHQKKIQLKQFGFN